MCCSTAGIDMRIRMLRLARKCAQLGARVRTIHQLTGLRPNELKLLLFDATHPPPRGRTPSTREWYHRANLQDRIQMSIVMCQLRELRRQGFGAGESLAEAYGYYARLHPGGRNISFDRAYDMAVNTIGLWHASAGFFELLPCPACRGNFVDTVGARPTDDDQCPYCRCLKAHASDAKTNAGQAPERPRRNRKAR